MGKTGSGLIRGLAAGLCALALVAGAREARAVTPGTKHSVLPAKLHLQAEDVSFLTADSVRVPGWWFQGPKDAPVVVIADRGAGTMADMLPVAKEFQARGFHVLTFDFRGFGPGSGPGAADTLKYVVFDSQWVEDMVAAFRYARARGGRHVFGFAQDADSAGALAAAARERTVCDGVAIEGVFRTSQDFLAQNGTANIPGVTEQNRRLVEFADEPFSAVGRLMVPMLALLAGKDDVTPPDITRKVAARALVRGDVWSLPEAGHAGAELTPGYFDRVTRWYRQWLAYPYGGQPQPQGP